MAILNLTQHPASAEQVVAGVMDVPVSARAELLALLTFDDLPSFNAVANRATRLAEFAYRYADDSVIDVMIGGAPFLMAQLETALAHQGLSAVYAFSRRESSEEVQADGSVRKTAVFRHCGFVNSFED